jgi:Proteasome stabiliser
MTSAVPSVARNDASVLETFFKNLEEEPKNVCVYIQDAMSSMIDVYKSDETPAAVRLKIDELVLSSVEKVNSELNMAFTINCTHRPF